MGSPDSPLLPLQSEATRLSLRPTFSALEPGLWSHGGREGKARACHLYREGSPFVAASGYGGTDAEALGEALGRYRQRVALFERELAETRRTEGLFACPGCFPDPPADRGCEGCRGGLVATACCAYCDAEIEAPAAACQCGDPEFVLCRACETPGRHLAQCARPITCHYGSGPPPGLCGKPVVAGTPWCLEHRELDRLHALADRRGYGVVMG